MMPLVLFGGLKPQDIPFPIRDNKEHQKIFTFNELESVGGGGVSSSFSTVSANNRLLMNL